MRAHEEVLCRRVRGLDLVEHCDLAVQTAGVSEVQAIFVCGLRVEFQAVRFAVTNVRRGSPWK